VPVSVPSGSWPAYIEAGWGGFAFHTENMSGGIAIYGLNWGVTLSPNTRLIIPDKISGKDVVTIANSAFLDESSITQVVISGSVETIGPWAFSGTSLYRIDFLPGSRLRTIDRGAFQNTQLKWISIPESVHDIGAGAFLGVHTLCSVYVKRPSFMGITRLGDHTVFPIPRPHNFMILVSDQASVMAYRTCPRWSVSPVANIRITTTERLSDLSEWSTPMSFSGGDWFVQYFVFSSHNRRIVEITSMGMPYCGILKRIYNPLRQFGRRAWRRREYGDYI